MALNKHKPDMQLCAHMHGRRGEQTEFSEEYCCVVFEGVSDKATCYIIHHLDVNGLWLMLHNFLQ